LCAAGPVPAGFSAALSCVVSWGKPAAQPAAHDLSELYSFQSADVSFAA